MLGTLKAFFGGSEKGLKLADQRNRFCIERPTAGIIIAFQQVISKF
jgi:hypothetical protein